MSYVQVYYGPAGTPGTDGVIPGESGTNGSAATPYGSRDYTSPNVALKFVGGAGGAGGSGAAVGGAGGDAGSYSFPGHGADGGSGGAAVSTVSGTDIHGTTDSKAYATGG